MTSVSAQSSLVSRPRSRGITSYGALKVSYPSIGFELGSSFLGKTTSLRASVTTRVVPKAKSAAQILPEASYKVSVLGAAEGIRQPLGLLIKMSRDTTVAYGTVTIFLGRSSAGCRDGRLHPAPTSLFIRPTKKRCINRRSNMHILFLYAYKVFFVHFHGSNRYKIWCQFLDLAASMAIIIVNDAGSALFAGDEPTVGALQELPRVQHDKMQ